jgi:UPF0716 family protein affecting phage T7 exclusion
MGFWRNVGYFWAVMMILAGIALLPYGVMSIGLGLFLFFYLCWDAEDEKIERRWKQKID